MTYYTINNTFHITYTFQYMRNITNTSGTLQPKLINHKHHLTKVLQRHNIILYSALHIVY